MKNLLIQLFILVSCVASIAIASKPYSIINGDLAKLGEFPYMIELVKNKTLACGGAIISDRFVLTAAHCTYKWLDQLDKVDVTSGSTYKNGKGQYAQTHEVKKMFVPDDFNPYTLENDISVIELKEAIKFDTVRASVKLPVSDLKNGTRGTITGWGRQTSYSLVRPTILRKLRVVMADKESCQAYAKTIYYGDIFTVHDTEICGFSRYNTGYGLCHGDSGGPLVSDKGYLVGIATSIVSSKCGVGNIETYSNVYKFLDFINSVMDGSYKPQFD